MSPVGYWEKFCLGFMLEICFDMLRSTRLFRDMLTNGMAL